MIKNGRFHCVASSPVSQLVNSVSSKFNKLNIESFTVFLITGHKSRFAQGECSVAKFICAVISIAQFE